jgi:poly(3-hydroxybutyrate) depolymerase
MDSPMRATTCPPGIVHATVEGAFAVYEVTLRGTADYFNGALARHAGPADVALDVLGWLQTATNRVPPQWATDHTVIADWPIARLRDFSGDDPRER